VRNGAFRETFRYSIQGLALTAVFVSAIRWPESPIFSLLNTRPMRFIGTLSYTLYLVHFLALNAIQANTALGKVPGGILALAISFVVAWGMLEVVEKPCAALRRKLHA